MTMTSTTDRQQSRLTLNPARPEKPTAPAAAPAAEARPDKPESDARPTEKAWKEPLFAREFARLSALVPPGAWPATLPTSGRASMDPRPVQLGISERVTALLPEAEHAAFHEAMRHFARVRPYL